MSSVNRRSVSVVLVAILGLLSGGTHTAWAQRQKARPVQTNRDVQKSYKLIKQYSVPLPIHREMKSLSLQSSTLTPDGRYLFGVRKCSDTEVAPGDNDDRYVAIGWDLEKAKEISRVILPKRTVELTEGLSGRSRPDCFSISEGGWYLACETIYPLDADRVGSFLCIWDLKSGKEAWRAPLDSPWSKDKIDFREQNLDSLFFSPDGKYVVGCYGSYSLLPRSRFGKVRVWAAKTGEETEIPKTLDLKNLSFICFLHDGKRLLAGDTDGKATLWDLETAKRIRKYDSIHNRIIPSILSGILDVRLSPDDRFALVWVVDASNGLKNLGLWDLENDKVVSIVNLVSDVDGLLLSVSSNAEHFSFYKSWSPRTIQMRANVDIFSPGDTQITLWDTRLEKVIGENTGLLPIATTPNRSMMLLHGDVSVNGRRTAMPLKLWKAE